MPLPVEALPATFRRLKFTITASMCARVIPNMRAFLVSSLAAFKYLTDEDGKVSDAFAQDLKLMVCSGGGGGGGDTTCPALGLAMSAAPADAQITVTVASALLNSGYSYTLEWDNGGGYASLDTGTCLDTGTGSWTTGAYVFVHAGLVNGTTHAFRFTASKTGCPDQVVEQTGVVVGLVLNLAVTVMQTLAFKETLQAINGFLSHQYTAFDNVYSPIYDEYIPSRESTVNLSGGLPGNPTLVLSRTGGVLHMDRRVAWARFLYAHQIQAALWDLNSPPASPAWTDVNTVNARALLTNEASLGACLAGTAVVNITLNSGNVPTGCFFVSVIQDHMPPFHNQYRYRYLRQLPLLTDYTLAAADLPAEWVSGSQLIKNIALRARGTFDDGSTYPWSGPLVFPIGTPVV